MYYLTELSFAVNTCHMDSTPQVLATGGWIERWATRHPRLRRMGASNLGRWQQDSSLEKRACTKQASPSFVGWSEVDCWS